jgi:hypothetical protein
MFRARPPTQHICVGYRVPDFNGPLQICVYYHQCYLFSAFFQRVILFPNRSGFYRNKGDVPQTTSAFCFPTSRARTRKKRRTSLRSKPSKICNFVTTSTNVHHENASSQKDTFPPSGEFVFLKIICAGTSSASLQSPLRLAPA